MATTNITPSDIKKLKIWARDHRGLAKAVCEAKAFAEMERDRVNSYVRVVFDRYEFTNDMDGSGEKISDPSRLYLSQDEDQVAAYYADCDRAHREHGFNGPEGHCPALVAEGLLADAENALLIAVGEFAGVNGMDFCRSLSLRSKALDWALTVCLGELS